MHKYIIARRSENKKTGPMLVTTSPRYTCPSTCSFKDGLCYAERGFLGAFTWNALDRSSVGKVYRNGVAIESLADLALAIRTLPDGAMWRHNQAGDLMPDLNDRRLICTSTLDIICSANVGRRGFTFTHFDPTLEHNRRAILSANQRGFRINLSADTLLQADAFADIGCAPVTVILPKGHLRNTHTPQGRKVIVCPALTHGVTCSTCKLCTRERTFIVGFPLH